MAKARKSKLKVFRTPIGFHDAYVAAPSQKAALEAWGSDANLFARGSAEEVTDPELTKAPLERPGEVIKKLRASDAEQIRALGKSPAKAKRRTASEGKEAKSARSGERKKRKPPRPSRAAVDKAERALETADNKHRTAVERIKDGVAKLEKQRRELESKHRDQRERLQDEVERAREQYSAAMAEWAEE